MRASERRRTYVSAIVAVVVAAAASVGCATKTYRVPGTRVTPTRAPGVFIAGAAKVDITPPPGFPIAGHGISAGIARGYWSKLHARAFYFRDGEGRTLAFVSADLYAIGAGLRLEVLRRVNAARTYLPPDGLVLAATHTHHGPGGYMTAEVYNGFGAALPGFEEALFDRLADRISSAVIEAARDAKPASLMLYSGAAPGLQRNRAIAPFFKNEEKERDTITKAAHDAGVDCPGGDHRCPRFDSVDPSLAALAVVRNRRPEALLVFFAIHPTAMTHSSPLYSPDLTGHAMSLLEQRSGDSSLVAGFFNGAEGDISPNWRRQDRTDVLELGERLADAVTAITRTTGVPDSNPTVARAMKEFPRDWRHNARSGEPKLASRPLPGAAQIGGAEDGRTAFFYLMGWRGGIVSDKPNCDRDEQGCKEPALGAPLRTALENLDAPTLSRLAGVLDLTSALSPPKAFPSHLPISVLRIGSLCTFVVIPVEMTTAMAWRVRESVSNLRQQQPVIIVGLANEFFSYTTTPEEYTAQQYEGASTLAGPEQGRAIEQMIHIVAGEISSAPPIEQTIEPRTFRVGPWRKAPFGPARLGRARAMIDEDLEPLWPPHLAYRETAVPRFKWFESSCGDWKTRDRRVRVVSLSSSGGEPDASPNILVLLDGCGGGVDGRCEQRPWSAIWLPARGTDPTGQYYFEVETGDGQHICSPTFRPSMIAVEAPVPDVGKPTFCPAPRGPPGPPDAR